MEKIFFYIIFVANKSNMKFTELSAKIQNLVKFIAAVLFLIPILIAGSRQVIPYLNFVIHGPELVRNVHELKESLFVLTGVVASDLEDVDDITYYIHLDDNKVPGRIKVTLTGNMYVFVPDGEMGERTFAVNYNYDRNHYYAIDFEGNYMQLFK